MNSFQFCASPSEESNVSTVPALTYGRLKEVLIYDPLTGIFTWKLKTCHKVKVGNIAGSLSKTSGYREIRIDRVLHAEHRLAYLYMEGRWPAATVDHRDLNRSNNVWKNLRPATYFQNNINVRRQLRNKSGVKGVVISPNGKRFIAQCGLGYEKLYLGTYDTALETKQVYDDFAKAHHGEFFCP